MKYLKIFKNWRIIALTFIAFAAILLIAGDGDKESVIVTAKITGFLLAYFFYRLWKEWWDSGLIDELKVFNDKE